MPDELGAGPHIEGSYEMLWDCKFCGSSKLLGKTHRFCPACGSAQDPASRYFPSDDEKVLVADHVYTGVDRICSACSTPNSANAEFCYRCGAPLENAAAAAVLGSEVRGLMGKFETSAPRDVEAERFQAEMQRAGVTKAQSGGGSKRWIIALVALLVVGAGIFAAVFLWTKETTVSVVSHSWNREIKIEQLNAVSDNAWCDSMPSGAYSVSRRREQRGSNRVPDGEECSMRRVDQGDGTFRQQRECRTTYREEPVFDDKCYFTIDRWTFERSETAAGMSLAQAAFWPETNLSRTGSCLGCEREGERIETYTLTLRDVETETEFQCSYPEDRWRTIEDNSRWHINISVVTGAPQCETLEAA